MDGSARKVDMKTIQIMQITKSSANIARKYKHYFKRL